MLPTDVGGHCGVGKGVGASVPHVMLTKLIFHHLPKNEEIFRVLNHSTSLEEKVNGPTASATVFGSL